MNAESEAIVAAGYDAVYRAVPGSPTLWQIWLDHAAGLDFPAAFSHISFVTIAELRALAETLRLDPGTALVDLACGMAGPSLWFQFFSTGDGRPTTRPGRSHLRRG